MLLDAFSPFLSWPHECELTWALSLLIAKSLHFMGALSLPDTVLGGTFRQCHLPTPLSMEPDVLFNISSPRDSESSFTSTLSCPEIRFIPSCHSLTNCVSSYGLISFSLRITHTHACSYLTASVSLGVLVVQLGCP